MAEGQALEEVDLAQFDSEYVNTVLMKHFRGVLEDMPISSELRFSDKVTISAFENHPIEYSICVEQWSSVAECSSIAKGFLKEIRFEELWLLITVMMNEQKLILVSNDVSIFGRAMYVHD